VSIRILAFTLWWVDLGWMPGAHQAALSLPFSAGRGEENKMERKSWVKIKAVY